MLTFADIEAAAARLKGVAHRSAAPGDLRALAMMSVQIMVEATGPDDYDRRDELFGWICDHIAGERLIVKLTHGDRVLMVEFPDQQKFMWLATSTS